MRETAPRFAGIGGHHSHKAGTVEWLTPPWMLAELGPFDLDPCAPMHQPYPTARHCYTRRENGLQQKWFGRVLLNPPYSTIVIGKWLARMADHDHGIALIFARTETEAFFRYVWERAAALLFMEGRMNFHLPSGRESRGNAGAPTVLCAYGIRDADVLAGCSIAGQFVPLRIPRALCFAVLIKGEKRHSTWRELLAEFFADRRGPVELAELYRYFRGHPKAAGNRNVEAKVRQQLQRGGYRREAPGLWGLAAR